MRDLPFATQLSSCSSITCATTRVANPTWPQVENILQQISGGEISYMELNNDDGSIGMPVYCENHKYFIGICVLENKNCYYWNGHKETNALVSIAGHYFNEHFICDSDTILQAIIKEFYFTGKPLATVNWICENLNDRDVVPPGK